MSRRDGDGANRTSGSGQSTTSRSIGAPGSPVADIASDLVGGITGSGEGTPTPDAYEDPDVADYRDRGDETGVDHSPTTVSSTLAVAVVALVGLVVGGSVAPVATVAALLGTAVVTAGVAGLQADGNARRALGSVGVVLGSQAVGWAVLTSRGLAIPVVAIVAVAALAAGTDALVAATARVREPVVGTAMRSVVVLVAGVGMVALASVGALEVTLRGLGDLVALSNRLGPFTLFVAFQFQCLLVLFCYSHAVPVLSDWLSGAGDRAERALATLERFEANVADVPRGYYYLFVGQVLALGLRGEALVTAVLASTGVVGAVVGWVLGSGVLNWAAGVAGLALLAVLAGRGVEVVARDLLGTRPQRALALGTGGAAAAVLSLGVGIAVVVAGSPSLSTAVYGSPLTLLRTLTTWSSAVGGLIAAALFGLALVGVVAHVVPTMSAWDLLPVRSGGFAVAATALFVATLVAAEAGAPAPVVFVGVAGVLASWDLGSHATDLGQQVGRLAETRQGELVHAIAVLLVGVGGVAFATAVLYLLLPSLAAAVPQAGDVATTSTMGLGLVLAAYLLVTLRFQNDR